MPRDKGRTPRDEFEQKLDKLRMKIDLLPESQRPHLYELADTIRQQCRRTEKHDQSSDADS